MDKKNPGTFNQAVMELGALICTPKQPKCVNCPVSGKCQAFLSHLVESFPVKAGKILQRNRFFYYLIISENEKTFIQKRIGKDIWEGLYQFPLIESQKRRSVETIITCREIQDKVGTNAIISKVSEEIKHVLSHQKIFTRFIHIETASAAINSNKNYKKVSKSKVSDFPMPRLITRYLENNAI